MTDFHVFLMTIAGSFGVMSWLTGFGRWHHNDEEDGGGGGGGGWDPPAPVSPRDDHGVDFDEWEYEFELVTGASVPAGGGECLRGKS